MLVDKRKFSRHSTRSFYVPNVRGSRHKDLRCSRYPQMGNLLGVFLA